MIGRQECSIYRLVVDLMEESTVIYLGIIGKQLIYLLHIELYIVDDSIDELLRFDWTNFSGTFYYC